MKFPLQLLAIVTLSCLSGISSGAEKRVDGYIVHYSAFASDFLSPEIASSYGITRSRDLALLNVTVQRENENGNRIAVDANVKATTITLSGKYKAINMRRIADGDAIYHIAEFNVIDGETMRFSIVVLDNEKEVTTIEFSQQFFK